MRHLTTITRFGDTPRAGLELLWAPVALAPVAGEPANEAQARGSALTDVAPLVDTAPERRAVGHVVGVIVDDDGSVRLFVVALRDGGRILVPLDATEIGGDEVRVRWTPEQLDAQPVFANDALLSRERWTGEAPQAPRWMPARPSVVPPGPQSDPRKAARGAVAYAGVSAVAGALLGLAVGGPLVALGVALFFGAGGGVAGAIAGGSRDNAADAVELERDRDGSPRDRRILALERRLRGRELFEDHVLAATPIVPATEMDAILRGYGARRAPVTPRA